MLNHDKSFLNIEDSINGLKEDGVAVIKNQINKNELNLINEKVRNILKYPSILGNVGFSMKDPFQKTYDAFLLDKIVPNVISNKNILKIIKNYLRDEIVISEVFLKHDFGDNLTYFPYHRHTGHNGQNKLFGCGLILYLHDTEEGAFCYSIGSHKENLDDEPEKLYFSKNKDRFFKNLRRINAKMGDILIFDESGFHGPEQPTQKYRSVIISGYRSKKIFNNQTKTEIPFLNTSFKLLDEEQKSALGLNNDASGVYSDYHLRNKTNIKNILYLYKIIQIQFFLQKIIIKIKKLIKK